jgi:hypothetical protein
MKKGQRLHANSILKFLKSSKRLAVFCCFLFLFSFLNLVVGCSYYKVRSVDANSVSSKVNKSAQKGHPKYIILHSGTSKWHLNNAVFNEDTKEISGVLEEFDNSHNLFESKSSKGQRFRPSKVDKIAEVHIYTTNPVENTSGLQLTIPYSSVSQMEVYDNDGVRSTFSVVGATIGVIVIALLIIAATKGSCPFVYVKDGENYVFDGEIYPGAILPSLERDDYLQLKHLKETNGVYSLRVTNELKEIQKTDLTELIVVNHPENAMVLMSQKGEIYSIQDEVLPVNAYCNATKIDTKPFLTTDQDYYSFDFVEPDSNPNSVVLEFDNTHKCNLGKLHLNLKNSYWMEYIYGKFNEQFGNYYNTFHENQKKYSKEKCMEWRENQNIPLSVYVKDGEQWKLVENVNTVGPLSNRDIVVAIPLNNATAKTQIKLVCGYRFWDLDYAGMDFSKNEKLVVNTLRPSSATDENGNDVAKLLSEKDKRYLVQPNIGNEVTIDFKAIAVLPNSKQTFFFKTNGYYEYIRNYTGNPDFKKLKTFREKGALNNYSVQLYKEFVSNSKNTTLMAAVNE